ncbi:MAG: hypothetical protein IMZ57_03725 [Acidobacteria bacterium]|nr:hypothetical protein [Acidobacteriota bacterium]MBE3124749.1 hypothetical protein [Acidobacteriota bacterium]
MFPSRTCRPYCNTDSCGGQVGAGEDLAGISFGGVGVVNIVRDNPKGLKVLPVFNAGF